LADLHAVKPTSGKEARVDTIVWTSIIFFARVFDVSLGTLRVQFIMRRKRLWAAATGFVEIIIYMLIVSRVIQDIDTWPYLLAYAAGFATGTLVGMTLSQKLSRQIMQVTVVSNGTHQQVEDAVRGAGFALTRYPAVGRDGPVDAMEVVCSSRQLARLFEIVASVEPKAFVYTRELDGLRGGFVYGLKSKI
jgi:uncharacterized protein YebE (UPF0316 family)